MPWLRHRPRRVAHMTVSIRVDPKSFALVEHCAHALAENDLPYLVDEMCEAGAFGESLQTESPTPGELVVRLGPMTELVLRECIDVAERKGWPAATKAKWLRQIMIVAGVTKRTNE